MFNNNINLPLDNRIINTTKRWDGVGSAAHINYNQPIIFAYFLFLIRRAIYKKLKRKRKTGLSMQPPFFF